MSGSKKNRSLGMTAAIGLVVDPELRRAAIRAAPPVARLGYTLGKRVAAQQARGQLEQASETFSHLASLLTTAGPHLAQQLGLTEPEPPPRRRLAPALAGFALVGLAVVVATDPGRRRRLQRLVVH